MERQVFVPLIHLTSSRAVMGEFVNRRALTVVASGISVVVLAANAYLLGLTFGVA